MDSKVFTIDIDEIVRGKAGAKARFVPRFVLSWLKRIIHQDEVNEFILSEGDKQGMPWLDDCMEYLGTTLNVKGLENLPDDSDGRLFTFVSNHPLGGPDGVALGHLLGHRYDGETAALAPRREVFFEMIGIVQHKLAVEPNRNSLSVDGDAQFVPTPFAFVKLPVEPIAVILAVPANSVRREDGSRSILLRPPHGNVDRRMSSRHSVLVVPEPLVVQPQSDIVLRLKRNFNLIVCRQGIYRSDVTVLRLAACLVESPIR